MKIEVWDYSPTPGPSHDQWMKWNNEHGAALRMACCLMMKTKEDLANLVVELETGECRFDDLDNMLGRSRKFFTDMADVIESAQARLIVGASVVSLRVRKGEIIESLRREKPKLSLVKAREA